MIVICVSQIRTARDRGPIATVGSGRDFFGVLTVVAARERLREWVTSLIFSRKCSRKVS